MPVTPAHVNAAAAELQRLVDQVDAKVRAREEAAKARKQPRQRAIDTRRCILVGRAVIERAKRGPRGAQGLIDILEGFLKRDADRKVMAPLLDELHKIVGPPPGESAVVPLRPKP